MRVQSMLDKNTMDTEACAEQVVRIARAGGELARVAVPGMKEAKNLQAIKARLVEEGCDAPLVADVHFSPEVAEEAARHVEKVRVNPGNFAEKRRETTGAYTDEEYEEGVRHAEKVLRRFAACCKKYRVAVRVGTNHGSLSARVLSRHGNTVEGMVEATMEYLRVFSKLHFSNVVASLKSSDCRVMVQATRLLVARMNEEQMGYPLHLGVTEAGEGEDGRVRSAVGIGTLLNEGIGDTVRVSLTESPEEELAVARMLVDWCRPDYRSDFPTLPERCQRPFIVADCRDEGQMEELGFEKVEGGWKSSERSPEMIRVEETGEWLAGVPANVGVIAYDDRARGREMLAYMDAARFKREKRTRGCLEVSGARELDEEVMRLLTGRPEVMVVMNPPSPDYGMYRETLERLAEGGINNKIITRAAMEAERELMHVAVPSQVGGIFLDRLSDGLWISCRDAALGLKLSMDVLQSAGARRYKTEFISCPGCGRTLFRLQESARAVKQALSCFPGLKIAVMGCIVNGPGEMGDADYGYVGAGPGKVTLYKGGKVALANVPEEKAAEELRSLIAKDMKG